MAIRADQTEPGRVYRTTRRSCVLPGAFYMRPERATAAKLVTRLRKRGNAVSGHDMALIQDYRRDPSRILLRQYVRGIDSTTGQRYERVRYVLFPADYTVREVAKKPGYKVRS